MKRRNTRKIIEEDEDPSVEYSGVKFPGKEIVDIRSRYRMPFRTSTDQSKLRQEWLKNKKKKYTNVHTHPTELDRRQLRDHYNVNLDYLEELNLIPSTGDLMAFLRDDQSKCSVIAPRETKTGKIRGYFIIRKTKRTPRFRGSPVKPSLGHRIGSIFDPLFQKMGVEPEKDYSWLTKDKTKAKVEMRKRINEYGHQINEGSRANDLDIPQKAFDSLAKDFHLRYRFVPAEGYELNRHKTKFIKKKNLESQLSATAGILLILSVLFSSAKLTGFAIGNNLLSKIDFAPVLLFIFGMITIYFLLRLKNNAQHPDKPARSASTPKTSKQTNQPPKKSP